MHFTHLSLLSSTGVDLRALFSFCKHEEPRWISTLDKKTQYSLTVSIPAASMSLMPVSSVCCSRCISILLVLDGSFRRNDGGDTVTTHYEITIVLYLCLLPFLVSFGKSATIAVVVVGPVCTPTCCVEISSGSHS